MLSKNILSIKILHPSKPFLIFDILKNPFNKQMCNAIIMLNVLEHIKDDLAALKEVNKFRKIYILIFALRKMLYDQYDLLHYRRCKISELVYIIEETVS